MLRMTGLTMALALLSTSAHACVVPYVRFFAGHTVDRPMTVKTGRPCTIRLRWSSGPTSAAKIVQRAKNGTVSIGAGNDIIYRSQAGFVGQDKFTYERNGLDARNNPVTFGVRVNVTVQP
jgi:hypothetical protein